MYTIYLIKNLWVLLKDKKNSSFDFIEFQVKLVNFQSQCELTYCEWKMSKIWVKLSLKIDFKTLSFDTSFNNTTYL